MMVYVHNGNGRGFGYGYDGHKFFCARYDDGYSPSGYSSDGLRQSFSSLGWVTLSETTPETIEKYFPGKVEVLKRRFAEEQAAAELARQEREAWGKEVQAVVKPESTPDPDLACITLAGETWPRWQWALGICVRTLTDAELAAVANNGLAAERQPSGSYYVFDPMFAGCPE